MAYDSIHNITNKLQGHQKVTPGGATVPFKKTSYAHSYAYTGSHPHAPTKIGDFAYSYDKNGNQTGWDDLKSGQKRVIVWDEENRIQEIHDNGHTTDFKYNDAGERVIKRGEQGETAYVNQFWTIRNKSVGTKHVFVGETRIASKVVPGSANVDPGDLFGSILGPWAKQPSQGKKTIQNPHYAGNKMPANLPEDNFVFFYHPDHLGSTEFVTDVAGELYEHVQYFPFGETWVSEHKNTEKLPYLFTSKELDEDTGLYYFGARYYDPRTSVWQSADPILAEYLARASWSSSVPRQLALYTYSWNNPVGYRDPTGLHVEGLAGHEAIVDCGGMTMHCTEQELSSMREMHREASKTAASLVAGEIASEAMAVVIAARVSRVVAGIVEARRARQVQKAVTTGKRLAETKSLARGSEGAAELAEQLEKMAADAAPRAAKDVGEVIRLPQSVGAAAREIFVRGGRRLASRQITNVEKITQGRGIRDVRRLVEQYGGK